MAVQLEKDMLGQKKQNEPFGLRLKLLIAIH
jgi:hypothetical protein